MKIHIVGKGVVGTATGEGFRKWGHDIVYTDKGSDHLVAAKLHFVCTPEEAAPDVVRQLARRPAEEDIVIRSTVPPGTTRALAKELRRELFHNPEFLREKSAQEDFLTRPYAIVGVAFVDDLDEMRQIHPSGSRAHALRSLSAAYELGGVRCHVTDSTTSELVKLLTNAYLATLISFFNQGAALAQAANCNPYEVMRLMGLDSRVGQYGRVFLGESYSGLCLPKDLEQLLTWAADRLMPTDLLEAVRTVNRQLGGK